MGKPLYATKQAPSFAKEFGVISDRTVLGLASIFGNIDDGDDRTQPGAFEKTISEQFTRGRVKHFWNHDHWMPPVATVTMLREIGRDELPPRVMDYAPDAKGGLLVGRQYLQTPRGDEILAGIDGGAITEMSFGYDPIRVGFEFVDTLKRNVRDLLEVRLFDTSDVNWGMNSATVAAKTAIPFVDEGAAPADAEWSAPVLSDFTDARWEDLDAAEQRRISAHFAWAPTLPPERFSDLKLGHHQPSKRGVGTSVWRGVAAAMGALLGARGGVEIPDEQRRSVYNHLAKEYAVHEKEPPDFKLAELAAVIRTAPVFDEKTGRVLSAANLERLNAALATLREILDAAEPRPDVDDAGGKALTALRISLALRERELNLMR